ncbi:E3 ubiquitin-protein ligase ATL4-like [Camellia sinensis]|uniref:E3 ubiquitin-protein ligase ATL4-like n=1 Tax=Camellia sinensis TaxID=4442 RepID=UPI001035C8AE|nr:E3 ubiquitin-protein ligase ATL4-like [Camellia sinensis]
MDGGVRKRFVGEEGGRGDGLRRVTATKVRVRVGGVVKEDEGILENHPHTCVDDVYSPPFLIVGGGTTTFTIPQINHNDSSPPSSSSSPTSSLIIVIIIIASSVIVTASLYLLFRFITQRCNNRSFAAVHDVVSSRNNRDDSNRDRCLYEQRNSSNDLINSLPLFTFDFVTGNIVSGYYAVCLSKFERNDQLRFLPLCCYAFHTDCIDAWLSSNQTCPLCRSAVYPTKEDVRNQIISSTAPEDHRNSFGIEIGSVSRRRGRSDSSDGRRSYSIGSFDYIVDEGYEVSVDSTHRRGLSDCTSVSLDSAGVAVVVNTPPGENLASEVVGRRWLRDYVDGLTSILVSHIIISQLRQVFHR